MSSIAQPSWNVAGVAQDLDHAITENGHHLVDLVNASPVLLVFLRHAGCTFCREAVSDIAAMREEIESTGTRIVLVHMGDRAGMQELLQRHKLTDVERICDTDQRLYQAFGLKKGTFRQLMGLKVWFRGLWAGLVKGHGLGMPKADSTQMPGVFMLDRGILVHAFRHRSAADRPCYTSVCIDGLDQEDRS